VSELPRSAPGAYPSVRARFTGASASTHTRHLALGGQGAPRQISRRRAPASERADGGPASVDGRGEPGPDRSCYDDDDMLTVADAARVARRSVRTLRRAYLSGRMIAHRDGNGRGVTIRYGDLRAWLTAEVIRRAPTAARAVAQVDVRTRAGAPAATGNAELLSAALQRRGRRARTSAAPRSAAGGSGSASR
jgi:hypothetical protein